MPKALVERETLFIRNQCPGKVAARNVDVAKIRECYSAPPIFIASQP